MMSARGQSWNIVFVTGLSSAGKDTITKEAFKDHQVSGKFSCLTKFTTRRRRRNEISSTSPTLYQVQSVETKAILNKSTYFGQFERNGNCYAFSRKEILANISDRTKGAICIYSGCDRLASLREEVRHVMNDMVSSSIQKTSMHSIRQRYVLVSTRIATCLARLKDRELSEKEIAIKATRYSADQAVLDDLVRNRFFDMVIDNSTPEGLATGSRQLVEFLKQL